MAAMSSGIPPPSTWFSMFASIKSNWIKRVIVGFVLINGWLLLIMMGPFAIMLTALFVQVFCFREILNIGLHHTNIPINSPDFRSLCWYFLVLANYFCCGETVAAHFLDVINKIGFLKLMVDSHRFISFCFYLIGMIWFVSSLVRGDESKPFRILALTHTLLIIIVVQSYMIIENLFEGLIWVILPVSLVILNDIFAYVSGRFFGKTPLIKVSPKKTWEGFVGGGIGALISGFVLSNVMCSFNYLVCPIEYVETENWIELKANCTPSYLFVPVDYPVGSLISISYYPFTWHFVMISLFASIIAPFGGFCASGFKRAAKMKDFGTVIPGHGGIMDRFDCQFLMATFLNVYVSTFVRQPGVDLIFKKFTYLSENNQVQFYNLLKESLEATGLLLPENSAITNH